MWYIGDTKSMLNSPNNISTRYLIVILLFSEKQ